MNSLQNIINVTVYLELTTGFKTGDMKRNKTIITKLRQCKIEDYERADWFNYTTMEKEKDLKEYCIDSFREMKL